MNSRLKHAITILGLAAAGCAGDPTSSAARGGTLPTPAVDAVPVHTLSGAAVTSIPGVPVTGRNWNCRGCYI